MSEENKVSKNFESLENIIDTYKYCAERSHNEKFAEVAFLLLQLDGDKEIINKISEYIQNEHKDNTFLRSIIGEILNKTKDWIYWAENWLVHKNDI